MAKTKRAHAHTLPSGLRTYSHNPNGQRSFENVPAADDSCATRRNRFVPNQTRPDTLATATLLYTPTTVKPALLDTGLQHWVGVGGGCLLHPFIFSLSSLPVLTKRSLSQTFTQPVRRTVRPGPLTIHHDTKKKYLKITTRVHSEKEEVKKKKFGATGDERKALR